jgi:hypothetical protein
VPSSTFAFDLPLITPVWALTLSPGQESECFYNKKMQRYWWVGSKCSNRSSYICTYAHILTCLFHFHSLHSQPCIFHSLTWNPNTSSPIKTIITAETPANTSLPKLTPTISFDVKATGCPKQANGAAALITVRVYTFGMNGAAKKVSWLEVQ